MTKLRKSLFAIVFVLGGCSTVDGVTGFKDWKHPEHGRTNWSRDVSECEVNAQTTIPKMYSKEMLGTNQHWNDSAGKEIGNLFSVWDYTKKCLIGKGYKKDETSNEEKLWTNKEIKSKQTDDLCWGYGAEGGINYRNELIKTELMTRKKQECLDSFWVTEKKLRMDEELKKIISDLNDTEKK